MQIECHVFAGTPSRDDWGKKMEGPCCPSDTFTPALLTRSVKMHRKLYYIR
jgi:hypothetical protein